MLGNRQIRNTCEAWADSSMRIMIAQGPGQARDADAVAPRRSFRREARGARASSVPPTASVRLGQLECRPRNSVIVVLTRMSESARAGSAAGLTEPCRQLSQWTSTCVIFRGKVAGVARYRCGFSLSLRYGWSRWTVVLGRRWDYFGN